MGSVTGDDEWELPRPWRNLNKRATYPPNNASSLSLPSPLHHRSMVSWKCAQGKDPPATNHVCHWLFHTPTGQGACQDPEALVWNHRLVREGLIRLYGTHQPDHYPGEWWSGELRCCELFTRVLVDEALDVISELLLQDETLPKQATIPVPNLCHLIELCLKSTYFRLNDTFYEQVAGAARGSPLFPIVANLYMEAFEKWALDTSTQKPNLWIRYICGWCFWHLATWWPSPGWVPDPPQLTTPGHPIHNGEGGRPEDCIPWCAGRKERRQCHLFSIPEENTH